MSNKEIHLDSYLNLLDLKVKGVKESVLKTVDELVPQYIKNFTCQEHITGLLLGNVQSGKTSQLFGVVAAAADEGFPVFILLTTDNIELQAQTYKRALQMLDTFCICNENDYVRFIQNNLRKPTLVILKKNTNILNTWKKNIAASKFCEAKPLFIVDDEADSASLNTKVNKDEQSTINSHLTDIKDLATSSIYLQVTATPQALILQADSLGWKPSFVYYFPPGKNYLGGDFFYTEKGSYAIKITKDELEDLKLDSEETPEGLRNALLSFLVASAHIFLSGGSTCNFLIHPSVSISDHEQTAVKIQNCLNEMLYGAQNKELKPHIQEAWDELQVTKPDIRPMTEIYSYIINSLEETRINVILMNSRSDQELNIDKGINIIIGGNSLGRGVTFPNLQTVYYSRRSKVPQADTFWQHCRMFGYDRDSGLMRVYIPSFLLKMYKDLNKSNSMVIEQISNNGLEALKIVLPKGIKPTRKNVVPETFLEMIAGGVDRFSSSPNNQFLEEIDKYVDSYKCTKSSYNKVKLEDLTTLLGYFNDGNDSTWNSEEYINCINSIASKDDNSGILIIRKDRNLKANYTTVLSEEDRMLGKRFDNKVVLTLYRVDATEEKGWQTSKDSFWIPNIKLPKGFVFFSSID